MKEDNNHPRRLERVSHLFLTEEVSSKVGPGTSGDQIITNKRAHTPQGTVQNHVVEYHQLKNTVASLFILKRSCKGNNFTHNPDNDLTWLKGAEDILQDAITDLIKILRLIEINNKKTKSE